MRTYARFRSDDSVAKVGRRLLDRTLPKCDWTHAGHLAATAWLITKRPELDLVRTMPDVIRAYNDATGVANTDTGGYHETITQASIRATRAFLAGRDPNEPLFVSVNAMLASPLGEPSWIFDHWTRDLLFTTAARRAWCPPDVCPLPF